MRTSLTALGMLLAIAGPAAAASPQELCKDGDLAEIRISNLKSPASRPEYEKATRDHMTWYRSHGFKATRQLVGTVIDFDPATASAAIDPAKVMTIHLNSPGSQKTGPLKDEAWDAYVAEYRDSSQIASTMLVCLREPVK